jgi:DNA-directed RNA polymerase subunit RPC12/RpoP
MIEACRPRLLEPDLDKDRERSKLGFMLEATEIKTQCPKCSREIGFTLGQAKRSEVISCPCGHRIALDGANLGSDLKPVEDALADLDKSLSKLF